MGPSIYRENGVTVVKMLHDWNTPVSMGGSDGTVPPSKLVLPLPPPPTVDVVGGETPPHPPPLT